MDFTGGIASGIVGGLESGYGLYQSIQGNKLAADNKRPTYEIPPEIQQNLNQSQQMALEGLPDQQKQQYINNIQRSQDFGLQQLSSRKAGLAGLGGVVQSGDDSYNNLLTQDANARQKNQQGLLNARSTMAGYKDKAFQLNQLDPYHDKAAAARALQGAGLQNINTGLSSIAGIVDRNRFNSGTTTGEPGVNGNPQTTDQFFGQ